MKTKEPKEEYKSIIYDFPDLICISALNFFIIMVGVWILPQLAEHVQFYFALAILMSSLYFTKHIVFFIVNILNDKNKKT